MDRKTTVRGSGAPTSRNSGRPKSKDEAEKGLWSSMLDSVASGRKLPEKNLIVLGGNPETQREFLGTLKPESPKRPQDRHKKKPLIANDFALGYTYQDVLDADQEDILARLSIYMLSDPSPAFTPLVSSLLTPQFIPESLLVILLDWNEPWSWVQQLLDWVSLFRNIISTLSKESKEALGEVMRDWREKRRGISSYDTGSASASIETGVTLPLSQGEWDEPLGLPLCVVCQNAERIDSLEVEQNWSEDNYDFVLQFLRTILMKHGASLIYTSNTIPNSLPSLIHASLGIHSTLKRQALKHNVIDRDKILVPPSWDSWGKIRVLREGFDVEGVSRGWSIDISARTQPQSIQVQKDDNQVNGTLPSKVVEGTVLPLYESTIIDPNATKKARANEKPRIEVSVPNMQTFLASQQEVIARIAAEDEKSTTLTSAPSSSTFTSTSSETSASTHDHMSDQIGPVKVNMGGIQVDADDIVRKLQHQSKRDSSANRGETEGERTPKGKAEGTTMSTPDMKAQNEALQSFFSGLMKRGASNSPRSTPNKSATKDSGK